jgi:tight adherence protein C
MNLGGFLTVVALSAGLFVVLGFALVVASGGGFQANELLLLVALGSVGLVLPYLWLINRIRRRQSVITKSLPDSFDLVTTCVEAGLGLDAALARVAEKVEGPFAEELSRTLREVGMGRMRRDALQELGERTGVPDLITFVNAVVQAEQMGTGIGQVLRVQSEQLRLRRRQRAEEMANQAPVKMVFPLVLCIFPTLFMVILGPAAITLYENFSK